jgi:eukaryotic-like serine/threonine-protein kinase
VTKFPDLTNSPPKMLGKYEILGTIREGSMGAVCLARDPYRDELVAVKVCRWQGTDDAEDTTIRRLFFNEVQTTQHLQHPNIVRVLDAGVAAAAGQFAYLVMEYVSGGATLNNHIRPASLLPIERVVELGFQCARALGYAHGRGVVHRDFKPGNVLLTPNFEAKIADFGVAQWAGVALRNTMPRGFMGTPQYMSPEQAREEAVSGQSDIFSLGLVLYELLSGQHPYATDNLSRLVYRVCYEEPILLTRLRPQVPEVLQAIVHKALAKDLSQRYDSAEQMAADLLASSAQLQQCAQGLFDAERFTRTKELDFFRGFPDAEVWEIIRAGAWENFRIGDLVVREGDRQEVFYVIVSGAVVVLKSGVPVRTLAAGDCFGEMGYLAKAQRSATIEAKSPVSVFRFDPQVMSRLSINCQVRFLKVFLRTLIGRLSITTSQAGDHQIIVPRSERT